jgi:hypothetical protein
MQRIMGVLVLSTLTILAGMIGSNMASTPYPDQVCDHTKPKGCPTGCIDYTEDEKKYSKKFNPSDKNFHDCISEKDKTCIKNAGGVVICKGKKYLGSGCNPTMVLEDATLSYPDCKQTTTTPPEN